MCAYHKERDWEGDGRERRTDRYVACIHQEKDSAQEKHC